MVIGGVNMSLIRNMINNVQSGELSKSEIDELQSSLQDEKLLIDKVKIKIANTRLCNKSELANLTKQINNASKQYIKQHNKQDSITTSCIFSFLVSLSLLGLAGLTGLASRIGLIILASCAGASAVTGAVLMVVNGFYGEKVKKTLNRLTDLKKRRIDLINENNNEKINSNNINDFIKFDNVINRIMKTDYKRDGFSFVQDEDVKNEL